MLRGLLLGQIHISPKLCMCLVSAPLPLDRYRGHLSAAGDVTKGRLRGRGVVRCVAIVNSN